MPERQPLLPTGCLAAGPWPDTLREARTVLEGLGQDPSFAAVAHRVALLAPEDPGGLRTDLFWFCLGMLLNQAQGHTRLDLEAPGWPEPIQARLQHRTPLASFLADPALSRLVVDGRQPGPFIRAGRWISTHRLHTSEGMLAEALRARIGTPARPCAIPEEVLLHPTPLNPEQRQAVALGLGSPLALITGGPGTGKTSIVVALLRAALRLEAGLALDRILLAAPTGKAAQRMGEAIRKGLRRLAPGQGTVLEGPDGELLRLGPEPQTLHRALGYHPGLNRFRFGEGNPLPYDLVIVDEGSMIGVELMEALARALAPGARLILLGDADQLPSVDPGAVFRELVAGCPEKVARLLHSYRMDPSDPHGRHILVQALRIND
ncbi:MAG TPA: AAA family ATPase, partial [Holophaga sp.]|nr:AAA family ATPase [Holophaga sp.]